MEILSSSGSNIEKVAVIQNDKLFDYFELNSETIDLGSIYKSQIKKIIPGLDFLFVELDKNLNGFMKNIDTSKFQVGNHLMVQVQTLPYKKKLAKVSMDISIHGLNLVLKPNQNDFKVSREIKDLNLRDSFKLLSDRFGDGSGLVFRSLSEKASSESLKIELSLLKKTYDDIKKRYLTKKTCGLIFKDYSLPIRVIRNFAKHGITKVTCNKKSTKSFIDNYLNKYSLKLVTKFDSNNLFNRFDLSKRLKNLTSRKVYLPSGGYVVFDYAEGFVLVDVNTGSFLGKNDVEATILNTNIEATFEICTQLRIRNLSGIILIDFIDMKHIKAKNKLLKTLSLELRKDINRPRVAGLTNLGLVEITRKRTLVSANEIKKNICPACSRYI